MTATVAARLDEVREQIRTAALAADRPTPLLIAVSKRQSLEAVREAFAAGQRNFGENLAQEMAEKQAQTQDLDGIRWHFLGRIQTNKAKLIAAADCVHGVGSVRHARALSQASDRPLTIFLQVNVGDEEQKNGLAVGETRSAAKEVETLSNLRLEGLMCVPARGDHVQGFSKLAALALEIEEEIGRKMALSMGMSADFKDAIAAGATHVRIGTAIFGNRTP